MKRVLLSATAVLVLAAGVALVWRTRWTTAGDDGAAGVGDRRVSVADGRVSVEAPTGWKELPCTPAAPSCLMLSPPGAGDLDAIIVKVVRLEDGGGPADYYLRLPPQPQDPTF